jgi:hypothetical protein
VEDEARDLASLAEGASGAYVNSLQNQRAVGLEIKVLTKLANVDETYWTSCIQPLSQKSLGCGRMVIGYDLTRVDGPLHAKEDPKSALKVGGHGY